MANKTNKTIGDIKIKIENTINKIDTDNIDFGEIKMHEETQEFVLENEYQYDELINNLRNFINEFEMSKEKSKQEKINEKLINELNNGGETATLIAEIFNK
mgnify:CR=1 FL=1